MKFLLIVISCWLTLFSNVNAEDSIDANYMSYIDGKLIITQINIPYTHDNGTYAIGKLINSNIGNVILHNLSISSWAINSLVIEYSKTQDMDITD